MVLRWINKWTWNISESIREILERQTKPTSLLKSSPTESAPTIDELSPTVEVQPGKMESVDLTEIPGIGKAYETRLHEAGIKCVADLLDAEVESLSENTGISIKLLSKWIECGRGL